MDRIELDMETADPPREPSSKDSKLFDKESNGPLINFFSFINQNHRLINFKHFLKDMDLLINVSMQCSSILILLRLQLNRKNLMQN